MRCILELLHFIIRTEIKCNHLLINTYSSREGLFSQDNHFYYKNVVFHEKS